MSPVTVNSFERSIDTFSSAASCSSSSASSASLSSESGSFIPISTSPVLSLRLERPVSEIRSLSPTLSPSTSAKSSPIMHSSVPVGSFPSATSGTLTFSVSEMMVTFLLLFPKETEPSACITPSASITLSAALIFSRFASLMP